MSAGRWILGAADAVTRVSDGLSRADDLGARAARGSRGAARGLSGLHRVGIAERRRVADRASGRADASADAVTSGALYHSDADRESAISAIDLALSRFRADVEPRATAIDAHPARAQWWRAEVLPVFADWSVFRVQQADWIARAATDWSTYEGWLALVRGLRSGARAQGIVLTSPEPTSLPRTVFEEGALGRGGQLEAAWTVGRVLLYTAIGVAGAVGVYTVARDARGWLAERAERAQTKESDSG